jgi:hypothetical protein
MPNRTSRTGSELFIVDNSDGDWKVLRYLHDWCQLSRAIDIATGYFEIGSLLGLEDEWQKVDQIRASEVSVHELTPPPSLRLRHLRLPDQATRFPWQKPRQERPYRYTSAAWSNGSCSSLTRTR